MSDGGGVERLDGQRLGIAPPCHTALRGAIEREQIKAALLDEGPAENCANALMMLGALGYLLRRDMGTQELELLKGVERRLGLALEQLRGGTR